MRIWLIAILPLLLYGCDNGRPPDKDWHLTDGATAAAVTANHALLVTTDHGATWWQLRPKRLLHTFRHGPGQSQNLIAADVTPDGHWAVTADRDGLAWWDTRAGKALASWALEGIQAVALSHDGRWALIGLRDRAVYFSLPRGKTRHAFPHDRAVKAVALDARGRFALTGGDDGMAKLWDLETGKLRHRWSHTGKVAAVALSPRGTYAMTSALFTPIRVWKTGDGKLKRKLGSQYLAVTRAVFSPREGMLFTGHPSQGIRLWSVKSGRLLRRFTPARSHFWRPTASPVLALALVKKGKYLLSATSDGSVQRWRLRRKKP